MRKAKIFSLAFAAVLGASLFATSGFADGLNVMSHGKGKGGSSGGSTTSSSYSSYSWMSPDISNAWGAGFAGSGASMTFVDDFGKKSTKYFGNLGLGIQYQVHGKWTTEEGGMVAPEATIFKQDFSNENAIDLQPGFNVVNASYGFVGMSTDTVDWSQYPREQSMIQAAQDGAAVISKAAGNDAVAVGSAVNGTLDFLDAGLIGTQSAIFAGALDHNGTPDNKASLASYSNYAGSNVDVQNHFLAVGVEGDTTGLYGTSFAAPIISGYAAILHSKFTSATPTQITDQLLNTARTDTLVNYNAATYGRGEASLSNALAPNAIQ